MIIISQDKTQTINFDITHHIWIENPLENDSGKFEIYADGELLGEYATEEKAKDILHDITRKYLKFYENNREIVIPPKVYEMPKE